MEIKRILIKGKPSIGLLYDDNDFNEMKQIFSDWKRINESLVRLGSRAMNVPDLISEGLFSYLFKVYRTNGKEN